MGFEVRPPTPAEQPEVDAVLRHWSGGVARLGELVPIAATEVLVAVEGGKVAGVCTSTVRGDECEVVISMR